jgi:hypothetical protein
MKKLSNYLVLMLLSLLFTSCYTLSLNQTGRTVGKNNTSVQVTGGVLGIPESDDENQSEDYGWDIPKIQVYRGLTDNFDIGLIIGANKTGLLSKYQFIGNQRSKFAMAGGLNAFFGAKDLGSSYDTESMSGIEVPLFFSYHPHELISIYSNPTFSYLNVQDDIDAFEEPFYSSGPYKGLASGIQLNFPFNDKGVAIIPNMEISWSSPLYSNKYIFNLGFGVGIKF